MYPKTLRLGAKGTLVKWLQSLVSAKGAVAIAVDGDFGAKTDAAIKRFQSANDLTPDGIVGPATWGKLFPCVPYFNQADARWGSLPYIHKPSEKETIKSSACGPVSMAMVISGLTKREVLPPVTAKYAMDNGYRLAPPGGTSHAFFSACAKQYDLACRETKAWIEVTEALRDGKLVIANMGPGHYTKGGHFIVLWAHDPYSKVVYVLEPGAKSRTCGDGADRVSREAKKFFVVGV